MDKFLLVIHCQYNCVMSVCMRLTDYRPNDDLMYHVAAYFACFIYLMSQCEFKGYFLLTYLLTYFILVYSVTVHCKR